MMDIFNMLGGMGQAQQKVGQQLGTNPNQTAAAIEAAVPLLLGALTRNAAQPGGAQALESALAQHDGSALGMFGQGQIPDLNDGQKIVGHVFGNQQTAAANAIGQRAGIDPRLAMQVLSMLAPLVLAYLSRQRQGQGNVGGMNSGAQGGGIDIGSILGGLLGGGMGGAQGGSMGGGLGDVLGSILGGGQGQTQQPQYQQPQYQQPQSSGGPMFPGFQPGANSAVQGAGVQGSGQPNLGGLMGTLNNVLDSNGNGNALDDLIGMFGGRRA